MRPIFQAALDWNGDYLDRDTDDAIESEESLSTAVMDYIRDVLKSRGYSRNTAPSES